MRGYVAVIGLGVIGIPLASSLWERYPDRFVVLSDETHARAFRGIPTLVNGRPFRPRIITDVSELAGGRISLLIICVKNYSLAATCGCVEDMVDEGTVLLPLQNGVYARDYVGRRFPNNVVLDGFVQGPNTTRVEGGFRYENPGTLHIGSTERAWIQRAREAHGVISGAGVPCEQDEDIRHQVWKKLMLNVAGNALTALTEMDYSMFRRSWVACEVCRRAMEEFLRVANARGVDLGPSDVEDTMEYFLGYEGSKRTSMLEDVLGRRRTENEYIAGYIRTVAREESVDVPTIDILYSLMRVKEDVYLGRLG